ncbi:ribonuclease activity regulator RraA [Rhizobium phaseoli]|uniref:RraA family protein n=1 Tax=Rhizobium phaseoli TaxID=396 RepID=UPI000BBAC94F|nr:ribonuclease activity regulator RraA [Rhizobium phaseoli]PCD66371.1 ribonuclease activity regulator RraA [Rhizobium phaseoli]
MTALDPLIYAKLLRTNSASLSSLLLKRGLRNTAVRGVRPLAAAEKPMVGPAVTVRYIPAREDIDGSSYSSDPSNQQRKAIDTIPEGHVLVFDCRSIAEIAGIGAVLARRLVYRGCAGLVLDGGVRDTADMAQLGLPTYCLGPAAPANFAHHASDMNQPIACGGVAVYPDDIVFGDAEAVIIIPRKYVREIADEAVAMEEQEEFLKLEIESGKPTLGVYPPNQETLERYEAWRKARVEVV